MTGTTKPDCRFAYPDWLASNQIIVTPHSTTEQALYFGERCFFAGAVWAKGQEKQATRQDSGNSLASARNYLDITPGAVALNIRKHLCWIPQSDLEDALAVMDENADPRLVGAIHYQVAAGCVEKILNLIPRTESLGPAPPVHVRSKMHDDSGESI